VCGLDWTGCIHSPRYFSGSTGTAGTDAVLIGPTGLSGAAADDDPVFWDTSIQQRRF